MTERESASAIVGVILAMSRQLKLVVTAEGVETEELALLRPATWCREFCYLVRFVRKRLRASSPRPKQARKDRGWRWRRSAPRKFVGGATNFGARRQRIFSLNVRSA